MGRRSTTATKGGRTMNPTDAHRKEMRRKELKKNKKQRAIVRENNVRTRDPQDLFLDILKIEDQERRGNFYHSKRTESLQQTLDKVLAVWKEEVPVRYAEFCEWREGQKKRVAEELARRREEEEGELEAAELEAAMLEAAEEIHSADDDEGSGGPSENDDREESGAAAAASSASAADTVPARNPLMGLAPRPDATEGHVPFALPPQPRGPIMPPPGVGLGARPPPLLRHGHAVNSAPQPHGRPINAAPQPYGLINAAPHPPGMAAPPLHPQPHGRLINAAPQPYGLTNAAPHPPGMAAPPLHPQPHGLINADGRGVQGGEMGMRPPAGWGGLPSQPQANAAPHPVPPGAPQPSLTTYSAPAQMREMKKELLGFVPSALRVKRKATSAQARPGKPQARLLAQPTAKPAAAVPLTSKEEAYDAFMREMKDFM